MSKDAQLQQAVRDELAWEPAVTAAHVGVAANSGIVTLTGHVPNFWQKEAAETAAARVKGRGYRGSKECSFSSSQAWDPATAQSQCMSGRAQRRRWLQT